MNKNKKSRKDVLLRLSKYFLQYKFRVFIAFILMIGSNLFALLGPYLTGKAIDAIDIQLGIDFKKVTFYCILMAIFYVVSSILSYVLSIVMIDLSQKIAKSMRQDVFDKILSLPISTLDTLQAGDLINRISYDIDTVNASLSNDLLQAATGIISIIGTFIGMLTLSPLLLCVFLITVPISIYIAIKRSKMVRPLFRKRSAKLAELNGFSEEMLSGLKTIKAYSKEQAFIDQFKQKNQEAVDAYYNADYYGSLIGPAVNFVNNLGTVLISTVGAIFYCFNLISIGKISSFLLYARKFSGPISEYANILGEIQSALAAAERIYRLLDLDSEINDTHLQKLTQIEGKIEFQNVSFAYQNEDWIIQNLSFVANPKQTIAIVGPTGAGKTTIVHLMMRFYDIQKGQILIDNHPITDYTKESIRLAFTMVLQDTWIFEGTIFENIAYGKEDATLEEVIQVAKKAHIHDFIQTLPQGYQTSLTDGGINLSKGQKQLISIARAMLSTAHLLILDEATSNVDTRTEWFIQDAMDQLMKNKTCFVIAHRLSTIVHADLILVVQDGKIVEKGTHQELLNHHAFYASIYNAQFN